MGCDIHDYCEIKENDSWVMLYKKFKDRLGKNTDHPYGEQNYNLFGLLAGVRADYIPPISKLKGIPVDSSMDYLFFVERWRGEGHSYSYHTLQELMDYPYYNDTVKRTGVVTESQYKVFKDKGKPEVWTNDITGHLIENEEMEEYIKNPDHFINNNCKRLLYAEKARWEGWGERTPAYKMIVNCIKDYEEKGYLPELTFYTKVFWEETVRSCVGENWFKTLETLQGLAPQNDYSKIRMVFFFDN